VAGLYGRGFFSPGAGTRLFPFPEGQEITMEVVAEAGTLTQRPRFLFALGQGRLGFTMRKGKRGIQFPGQCVYRR